MTEASTKYLHFQNFQHLTGLDRPAAIAVDEILEKVDVRYLGGISQLRDTINEAGAEIPPILEGLVLFIHFQDQFSKVGFRCEVNKEEHCPSLNEISTPLTFAIVIEEATRREVVGFPLPIVLATAENVFGKYQVYQHTYLRDEEGKDIVGAKYTGVTKRGWRGRWKEHFRAAMAGSRYRFHGAIRHWGERASLILREIAGVALSEADAMRIEEALVAHNTLFPAGLNMIPGGYAGIRHLRQLGALGRNEGIAPDDRDKAIERFFAASSRRGLPNPLAAAKWCDPAYAEKVICGPEGRLKPDQVRAARFRQTLGQAVDEIAIGIGARNALQVSRLLSGATYGRIR